MAEMPCRNDNCNSYGQPHPNCKCYGDNMASGGSVERFCSQSRPHASGCPHFASGGPVDPEHTLGHAAIQHGFSGLLKKIGQSEKISPAEHAQNYLASASKGHDRHTKYSKSILGRDKVDPPETRPRKELETHLEHIRANPQVMLNIGGALGQNLPKDGALLAARAAQGVNYLESIRPVPSQASPLDKVPKVTRGAQQKYNRQLDIAEQPMLVMKHLKAGTLQPQDITTLQVLYPKLHQAMVAKMTERLIESKGKKSIPRHQRRSLGLLLGQPLDSTMTPGSMQAIMKANAGSSKEQSQPQGGKATASTIKEVSKAAKLYGTRQQDKELGK